MYFGFGLKLFVITTRKYTYTIIGLRKIYELIDEKTDMFGLSVIG